VAFPVKEAVQGQISDVNTGLFQGIFSTDLKLEQTRMLRALQPRPYREQSYNGQFKVTRHRKLSSFISTGYERLMGMHFRDLRALPE
jgi:hypothetical protein